MTKARRTMLAAAVLGMAFMGFSQSRAEAGSPWGVGIRLGGSTIQFGHSIADTMAIHGRAIVPMSHTTFTAMDLVAVTTTGMAQAATIIIARQPAGMAITMTSTVEATIITAATIIIATMIITAATITD